MEENEKSTCGCNEECKCDENCTCGCNEGKGCTCDENCTCGCKEDKECTCDENCDCGCKEDKECTCDKKDRKSKKNKELEEMKILVEKNKELEDTLLRTKAEFINYRKRLEEENAKFIKYANEDLVKELLPIIDNFERAIKLNGNDLALDTSKFLEGFKMIYCNTVSILEKYGVQAIDGSSKPFDPNYHEAVISEHIDGVEPGMVIEVLQKGYLLKGKVIRHAMVKVSA